MAERRYLRPRARPANAWILHARPPAGGRPRAPRATTPTAPAGARTSSRAPAEEEATIRDRRRAVRRRSASCRPTARSDRAGLLRGADQSELAERLSVPLGTIKSRMFTGLRRLRDLLAEAGLEPELQSLGAATALAVGLAVGVQVALLLSTWPSLSNVSVNLSGAIFAPWHVRGHRQLVRLVRAFLRAEAGLPEEPEALRPGGQLAAVPLAGELPRRRAEPALVVDEADLRAECAPQVGAALARTRPRSRRCPSCSSSPRRP